MQIPRPPKAITFDCWSTLIADVDWDATLVRRQQALVQIASSNGWDLDPEKAVELIEGSWREHVQAWREGKLYGAAGAARWVIGQLTADADITEEEAEALANELATQMEDATSQVGTKVVDGAIEAITKVMEAGIATALICDTGFTPSRLVRGFLKEHGFELDHYFFSDEVGVPKPHVKIFSAALDAVGVDASQAIHIGDLRRTDIAGGRAAGMATIRFAGIHDDGWEPEDVTGEEADHVLRHWDELHEVIGI
jgi:HAD superfamily hydrolase (TIGR01549 family)